MKQGSFLLVGPGLGAECARSRGKWSMGPDTKTPKCKDRIMPADPHGPRGSRNPPSLGIKKQLLEAGTAGFGHKTL